jgi:hypothetical protein
MRVSELFEDEDRLPDEAPLVLTIMKNLLKKGVEVRVYYKGDGGQIQTLEWDPPGKSSGLNGVGASSFLLMDGRWIVMNDNNLDKQKLHQQKSNTGKEWFTLSNSPNTPPV